MRAFVASKSLLRNFRSSRLSICCTVVGLTCSFLVHAAAAGDAGTPAPKATTPTPPYGTANFAGLGWGVGLSADFDVGGARVNTASVVNGIVRATDTSTNVNVGFVLEAHYFFKAWEAGKTADCTSKIYIRGLNCSDIATGPFVAIEVGGGTNATPNSGPITAYALGWMIGFRHPDAAVSQTSSWNFGVGLRVDPKSQVLGDGLVLNQPLPAGDSIRFKTEPRYGVMLLSSFSF